MKNQILLLLSLFYLPLLLPAQEQRKIDHHTVSLQVNEILSIVGKPSNFTLIPSTVPNAAAVEKEGHRYLLYNPAFLQDLYNRTGSVWSVYSVLSHEVAHHLLAQDQQDPRSAELQADAFSGFILRGLGATGIEARQALEVLHNKPASSTHPSVGGRLAAVQQGYRHEFPFTYHSETFLSSNIILKEIDKLRLVGIITLAGADGLELQMNKRGQLLKWANHKLLLFGRWETHPGADHLFILYDRNEVPMFVHKNGMITNSLQQHRGNWKAVE